MLLIPLNWAACTSAALGSLLLPITVPIGESALSQAQPATAAAPAAPPRLHPGSPAPALAIEAWLKGDPVSFKPGRVYIVEFWATWCGPCIAAMPHLSELQRSHADDLTVVGVTKVDRAQSADAIKEFVRKSGAKMEYPVALDDAGKTWDAYMTAAGQKGIPTSFVIDRKGNVAWFGWAMFLDMVLPRVLDGSWDPAKGSAEIDAIRARVEQINQQRISGEDPAGAAERITAFEKDYPELVKKLSLANMKYDLLLAAGDAPAAKSLGNALYREAKEKKDADTLYSIAEGALGVLNGGSESSKKAVDLDLSLNAIRDAIAMIEKPALYHFRVLGEIHRFRSEWNDAAAAASRAVEIAPDDETRKEYQAILKMYQSHIK